MRGIHFAGGEPFLDFERLLALVEMTRARGLPMEYVETNAFWCTTDALTRKRLEQLKKTGLPGILVSASPFHVEYIPFERTKRAVRIALEVFGPGGTFVFTNVFYEQFCRAGIEGRLRLDEYVRAVGEEAAARLISAGYSLIPGGRAPYKLGFLFRKRPAEAYFGGNCRAQLASGVHAHVDCFCNYITGFCAGISIGDARNLPALLREGVDLSAYPVLRELVTRGVQGLLQLATSYGYEPRKEGYIAKCHLCVDIRRYLVRRTREFEELRPEFYYENLLCPEPPQARG